MRRHWEENRRVHQLYAIWTFFDQMENIYCAMQLCKCRDARHSPFPVQPARVDASFLTIMGGDRRRGGGGIGVPAAGTQRHAIGKHRSEHGLEAGAAAGMV